MKTREHRMIAFWIWFAPLPMLLLGLPGMAQETIRREGERLNPKSSLARQCIVVPDPKLPLAIASLPCAAPKGELNRLGAFDGHYQASFGVLTTQLVTAFEIRFLLFDVWRRHVRTLSATEIEDIQPGAEPRLFDARWRLFSANEAEEHYASIAYVARVRVKDGRVLEGDTTAVLREALKFYKEFKPEDLQPKEPPPLPRAVS